MAERPETRVEWRLAEHEPATANAIAGRTSLHPAVARLLASRGWHADDAALAEFLSPLLRHLRAPTELAGMEAAVAACLAAIRRGDSIWIYGDYDVDGVTATALMISALRFLGSEPRWFIPHRQNDGYGMSVARIEEIAARGCRLLLTVDTGITAVEPIARARQLGMTVIVTDHHLAGGELPAATAVVNPNLPDSYYGPTRLCGVGIAFKFAHALLRASGRGDAECKEFLLQQLDLVALGTVADVVPLMGENRVLVRHGIETLLRSRRPGLRALLEVARLQPRPGANADIISFGLGPRLNAAGRTEDAGTALELLLTTDEARARELAMTLDEMNRERRRIEDQILRESVAEADSHVEAGLAHALVVGGAGWHLGVVGIVAARLTERYALPAVVLAVEGELARGSGRSVAGFDLHRALEACSEHLVGFGGHASAAGVRLETGRLPAFREAMNSHAAVERAGRENVRILEVAAEIVPREFDWRLYDDIQRLAPFGEGNPAPLLAMRGLRARLGPRLVGKANDHLKFSLTRDGVHIDGIGFGLGRLMPLFESGRAIDIVFRPTENYFQGERRLEAELIDARAAG